MSAVIHIGANKAASTTLQRCLFARHPDLHYVGEDGEGYQDYYPVMADLLWSDDMFWNERRARVFFSEQLKCAAGKTFVFSSEDIMTSPIASLCGQRLCKLICNADVLIIIRNQLQALASFYASHGAYLSPAPKIHYKKHVPLESWLEYHDNITYYGPFESFDYWNFITYFEDLFGKDRVKILMFEKFVQERENFCEEMAQILGLASVDVTRYLDGAHERKRHSWRTHQYTKFRSTFLWNQSLSGAVPGGIHLRKQLQKFLEDSAQFSVELPLYWQHRLKERYAEGNAKLVKKFGLPLAKYDYPI